jgi:hypothetical protein
MTSLDDAVTTHFRTASDNYAGLLSTMGLSEDAIAASLRSAIKGEPEASA